MQNRIHTPPAASQRIRQWADWPAALAQACQRQDRARDLRQPVPLFPREASPTDTPEAACSATSRRPRGSRTPRLARGPPGRPARPPLPGRRDPRSGRALLTSEGIRPGRCRSCSRAGRRHTSLTRSPAELYRYRSAARSGSFRPAQPRSRTSARCRPRRASPASSHPIDRGDPKPSLRSVMRRVPVLTTAHKPSNGYPPVPWRTVSRRAESRDMAASVMEVVERGRLL
jgi:hypothetical protein